MELKNLQIEYPNLFKEIDFFKNENLIFLKSKQKIWWKCLKCNDSWLASLQKRKIGTGCPFCCGQKVNLKNSLYKNYPEISKEFDIIKNNGLTSQDFTSHIDLLPAINGGDSLNLFNATPAELARGFKTGLSD